MKSYPEATCIAITSPPNETHSSLPTDITARFSIRQAQAKRQQTALFRTLDVESYGLRSSHFSWCAQTLVLNVCVWLF